MRDSALALLRHVGAHEFLRYCDGRSLTALWLPAVRYGPHQTGLLGRFARHGSAQDALGMRGRHRSLVAFQLENVISALRIAFEQKAIPVVLSVAFKQE